MTTPKLPPAPPRSPQNMSGLSVALTVTRSPAALTMVALRSRSAVSPAHGALGPIPPPRVRPTSPTPGQFPPGSSNRPLPRFGNSLPTSTLRTPAWAHIVVPSRLADFIRLVLMTMPVEAEASA